MSMCAMLVVEDGSAPSVTTLRWEESMLETMWSLSISATLLCTLVTVGSNLGPISHF